MALVRVAGLYKPTADRDVDVFPVLFLFFYDCAMLFTVSASIEQKTNKHTHTYTDEMLCRRRLDDENTKSIVGHS